MVVYAFYYNMSASLLIDAHVVTQSHQMAKVALEYFFSCAHRL